MRRKSVVDYGNVDHIKDKIHFIYADMQDIVSLISAMRISQAWVGAGFGAVAYLDFLRQGQFILCLENLPQDVYKRQQPVREPPKGEAGAPKISEFPDSSNRRFTSGHS